MLRIFKKQLNVLRKKDVIPFSTILKNAITMEANSKHYFPFTKSWIIKSPKISPF